MRAWTWRQSWLQAKRRRLAPVHDLVLRLGNVVTAVLVQLQRQDGHPKSGSGWVILCQAGFRRRWAGPYDKVSTVSRATRPMLQQIRQHLAGACLMGTGGAWASGSTIRQGVVVLHYSARSKAASPAHWDLSLYGPTTAVRDARASIAASMGTAATPLTTDACFRF